MSETDRASAQRQGEALTVRLPSTWTFGLRASDRSSTEHVRLYELYKGDGADTPAP
jgi:hypothetical protein